MPIVTLIIILVIIGVLMWAVNSFIPMDARFKQIINAIVIIAVILWLLYLFLPGGGPTVGRPHGYGVLLPFDVGLRLLHA
jgi:Na+-translocating ferredoxin:NAD+ oxidoreductase RnfA subunit